MRPCDLPNLHIMWSIRISVPSSPLWRVGLVASFNVTARLDSSDRLHANGHVVRPPQTDDYEWRLQQIQHSLPNS